MHTMNLAVNGIEVSLHFLFIRAHANGVLYILKPLTYIKCLRFFFRLEIGMNHTQTLYLLYGQI